MSLPDRTQHILITRLDNIGDVVFTLPLVGLIKAHYPQAKVSFLGTSYTKALLSICPDIDEVWDWSALQLFSNAEVVSRFRTARITTIIHLSQSKRVATLARRAGIQSRVTSFKGLPNWFYCNRWVILPDERKDLHEAARNIKMLKPLKISPTLAPEDIASYIRLVPRSFLPSHIEVLLEKDAFNLVLHPGSNGHGCEWPVAYFKSVIVELAKKHGHKIKIFITGGPQERERFEALLKESSPYAIDIMGLMNLDEFLTFLSRVDGVIASGTGPLHVSAALGVKTLGLFPPKKGISLTRWSPLGKQAEAMVCAHTEPCITCPGSANCHCMAKIPVKHVLNVVDRWLALV